MNIKEGTIYFAKIRDDVKIPAKRVEDGGYDLYANFEEDGIIIEPFQSKLIPTGLKSAFSSNRRVVLQQRGSTGIKNIIVEAGLMDSGFRGEWFVILYNANNKPLLIHKETDIHTLDILAEEYVLYPYSKAICQAKIQEVLTDEIIEITEEELMKFESDRGSGSLGSSNK
jgi:dUTP pyrophosphatase